LTFPQVSNNYFTERAGVLAVAAKLNRIDLIFRETPNADVGIDGQIELVSSGSAPGKLAAVQIKSGLSYFNDRGNHWAFYPEAKHKMYWEAFPLPVYLFLHNPELNLTYYTDVRYQLSIPEREREHSYISVLKINRLDSVSSEELMLSSGPISLSVLAYPELLKVMAGNHSGNASLPLTYLDLFCNGLTNLCRHIYFGMPLAYKLAEIYLEINESEFGVGVGSYEHDFLHDYTRFLISQNLAKIDYSDYLIDLIEREMQPQYIAPLTSRGRNLIEYIRNVEQGIFGGSSLVSVACERSIIMLFGLPSDMVRIPKIKQFGERLLSDSNIINAKLSE
jgi:Domain of unknown function (DUF4365)